MCNWEFGQGTFCPELWAQDSNALVCDYAYGKLPAGYDNGTDLLTDSDYAKGALHIVENQLAKAAYRLAGWMNTIATVNFGVGDPEDARLPGLTQSGDVPLSEMEWSAEDEQIVLGDFEL